MNWSALIQGASAVIAHPITKGTGLATLITAGLYAATAFGVAIPTWGFGLGPVVGIALYTLLPKKIEDEIDTAASDVQNLAKDIPNLEVDPTYPQTSKDIDPPVTTNFNKG